MDHSYGVAQDSGTASPGRSMFMDVPLKVKMARPQVTIKAEPGSAKDEGLYHVVIAEDFGHTEEVETTAEESEQLMVSSSGTKYNILGRKKDSRSSSIEDAHHDSGLGSMSSFVSDASGFSTSLHSASQRTYLASPMEVFVPNATSTPEDGAQLIKMEVQSPSPLSNHSSISELHRSVMVSGIKHSPSDSQMSVSPEEVAFIDRRPITPIQNMVSDISHMEAPADGYFSRENLRSVQNKVSCNLNQNRLLQRRRVNDRNMDSTPPRQAELYTDFEQRDRTPSPVAKGIPRLNLNDVVEKETLSGGSETRFRANILKTEPQPVGTASGEKMVIQIPALRPRTHTLTYGLRPSLEKSSAPSARPLKPLTKANFRPNGPSSAFSSLAQMNAAQQKTSTIAAGSDLTGKIQGQCPEPRDDSLTNIHWLHNLSSAGFVPNTSPLVPVPNEVTSATASRPVHPIALSPSTPMLINGNHIIIQQQSSPSATEVSSVVDSEKHIKKIAEECGRNQRPPYAYMHLIQMAIKSYPEQKATLKQIYTWIEETFPYYKYTNKKGWKNSIRHNLSLYNIFVRKRGTGSAGSSGCSYWTLQSGVKPMPKSRLATSVFPLARKIQGPPQSLQSVFPSTNSGKKGPAPLLPKPPPVQSYTIIPLPSDNSLSPSVLGSHAIVVTPDQVNMANSNGCLDTETIQAINSIISFPSSSEDTASAKINSLKRSQSDYNEGPQKKLVKVAPKPGILNRGKRTSLVNRSASFDTSDLLHQMSNMKFDNTFIDGASQDSQDGSEKTSEVRQVRAKKPRKEKIQYRVDSSDRRYDNDTADFEELEGACISIINNDPLNNALRIEEEMSSPLRGLLRTPPRDVKTSTPSKGSPSTPGSWISPIHGLSSVTDDQPVLLDMAALLEEAANGRLISGDPNEVSPGSASSSPGLGSLRSLGLPGLTPLKSGQLLCNPEDELDLVVEDHSPNNSFSLCNQSFTKLLGDFHLDSVIGDDLSNPDYYLSFGQLH